MCDPSSRKAMLNLVSNNYRMQREIVCIADNITVNISKVIKLVNILNSQSNPINCQVLSKLIVMPN